MFTTGSSSSSSTGSRINCNDDNYYEEDQVESCMLLIDITASFLNLWNLLKRGVIDAKLKFGREETFLKKQIEL